MPPPTLFQHPDKAWWKNTLLAGLGRENLYCVSLLNLTSKRHLQRKYLIPQPDKLLPVELLELHCGWIKLLSAALLELRCG
jgi:hypothetical protein